MRKEMDAKQQKMEQEWETRVAQMKEIVSKDYQLREEEMVLQQEAAARQQQMLRAQLEESEHARKQSEDEAAQLQHLLQVSFLFFLFCNHLSDILTRMFINTLVIC
jgi:hypothetical protein